MAATSRRFAGEIESVDDRTVYGWIYDRHFPERSPFITLFERQVPVEVARPTIYRPDLRDALGAKRSVGFAIRRRNKKELFCIAAPDGTLLDLNPNSDDLRWLLDRNEIELPPPVIYLHIQNSMGTSIRNALAENVSPPDVLFTYPQELGVPMEELFALPALTLASARLIFGHALFGMHEHLPLHGRYRTVLRCPIERLISNVVRILPAGSRPEDAVAFFLQTEIPEFDNYQTRVLSGCDPSVGGLTAEDVELATTNAVTWFDKIGFSDALGTVRATLEEFIDPTLLKENHVSHYDREAALQAFVQDQVREPLLRAVAADVYVYCSVAQARGHPVRNAELYASLGLI
jgi:hypothetical protein